VMNELFDSGANIANIHSGWQRGAAVI
jgi:hypothetical protein